MCIIVACTWACYNDSRGLVRPIKNTDQYYNSEIFKDQYKDVYGEWALKAISGGTTNGFLPDFEIITFQKIGIYKMFRNDSLLSYGRIKIQEDNDQSLKISFLPERGLKNIPFYASERHLFLREGHLNLFASCCNQSNYHFVRRK